MIINFKLLIIMIEIFLIIVRVNETENIKYFKIK